MPVIKIGLSRRLSFSVAALVLFALSLVPSRTWAADKLIGIYASQAISQSMPLIAEETIRDSLATVVHPNELLDGAVTGDTTRAMAPFPTTWNWQNHPIVLGLYEEHGRNLNLVGMILERIRFETHLGKEVIAHNTAQLAATLGAEGAIVTWTFSGNCFVDVMLTIRACEQRGIKTVLVTYEYGGKDGVDTLLLYYVPEAKAIVSTGSRDRWLNLPKPEKVVGPGDRVRVFSYPEAPVISAWDSLTLDARDLIIGGVDIWGGREWTCRAY